MKQTVFSKVIWMVYGFLILSAIIAILNALVEIYFHYGLAHDFLLFHFKYYIPTFTMAIYAIAVIIGMFFISRHFQSEEKFAHKEVRIVPFVVVLILAFILGPLTRYFSFRKLDQSYADLSRTDYLSSVDFAMIDQIIEQSILLAGIMSISALALFCLWNLRKSSR
ncbi:MAG: hypothetical protein HKN00_08920 [Flavobacteriaceae bacterium]|nr:hypothetical protein [Bacteroidia bacterium]NNF75291.1 hypothetical protein [Flavobacteriaceae bacterium]NNK72200.1 hypothetical protein [Flavobacteriaceae bacterium]